jgi:hypothetical protein
MSAIRVLLDHAIDYAGLFPPAGLGLRDAIANYAAYRGSDDAWALGRFVLPVARLAEFAEVARPLLARADPVWRLSGIAGDDVRSDLSRVTEFNAAGLGAVVDSFEFRAGPLASFRQIAELGPFGFRRFGEVPLSEPPEGYLPVMRSTLIGAKLRTGGVIPEAFPDPDLLLRWVKAIVDSGVALKCTAGLHHPVRGRYRLTYQDGAPEGVMFGYLNVMLAAAALRMGSGADLARAILVEDDASAFRLAGPEIRWRQRPIATPVLSALRAEGSLAFGSCSFREPLDELAGIPVS